MEIDPRTGLPIEAISWQEIASKDQKIKVTVEKKRYGKISTIVTGFDKAVDIKQIAKKLKNELACGGTYKNDAIELQGNHKDKVKQILIKIGFEEASIE